jgi:proline dehydrogenase
VSLQHQQGRSASSGQVLDFDDATSAFQARRTTELLRAYVVFSLCRPLIVKQADTLLSLTRKLLGSYLTDAVLRTTMFAHFCGGESADSIKPTVDALASQGIGSILDYAAESDIESAGGTNVASIGQSNRDVICRTYTYADEAECDKNADIFLQAIRAVRGATGNEGFAAIKITALGSPELLLRVSGLLVEVRKFFSRLDLDGDGIVSRTEWKAVCMELFDGTAEEFDVWFDNLKDYSVASGEGIDYVEWLETMRLEELPLLLAKCKKVGPLFASQLEPGEFDLLTAARQRARDVAAEARASGVRVLIDAEHSYFQPAIDLLVNELMRDFNLAGETCTVFNTYQAYLKDSSIRLDADMERARRRGYGFACKVVRGAYMELESAHAKKEGLPNPIHDCIEDTHANYDQCVAKVMKEVKAGSFGGAELMVASHNQASTKRAVQLMDASGLGPRDAVYFAQLYGMSDRLTNTLGSAGYRAYKYLPWGPVREVTPYLLRRAQENSSVAGGAKVERTQIGGELWRRFTMRS